MAAKQPVAEPKLRNTTSNPSANGPDRLRFLVRCIPICMNDALTADQHLWPARQKRTSPLGRAAFVDLTAGKLHA
jgi:hypothetical protein